MSMLFAGYGLLHGVCACIFNCWNRMVTPWKPKADMFYMFYRMSYQGWIGVVYMVSVGSKGPYIGTNKMESTRRPEYNEDD